MGGCIRFADSRQTLRRICARGGGAPCARRSASPAQSPALADTVNGLLDSDAGACRVRAAPGRPAGAGQRSSRSADLARQFELSGGFRSAASWKSWTKQAEKAEAAEAPVLEEAADGVRLMTVHTAEGPGVSGGDSGGHDRESLRAGARAPHQRRKGPVRHAIAALRPARADRL